MLHIVEYPSAKKEKKNTTIVQAYLSETSVVGHIYTESMVT